MVRADLQERGITDRRVLAAMASVPREEFVPPEARELAYADRALPLAEGQTISQPYIVARMTAEAGLTRRSRVLEIGTGSGYHTAVLAKLAGHIWSLERREALARSAQRRLQRLGIDNVTIRVGDGALGWPTEAPFDAIVAAAAVPAAPQPLLDQLAVGARLVIPIGDLTQQELIVVERTATGWQSRSAGGCRFVPLVSPAAFPDEA